MTQRMGLSPPPSPRNFAYGCVNNSILDNLITCNSWWLSNVDKNTVVIHVRSTISVTKYIRILSVSVRITDIRKISIRGYISAHL